MLRRNRGLLLGTLTLAGLGAVLLLHHPEEPRAAASAREALLCRLALAGGGVRSTAGGAAPGGSFQAPADRPALLVAGEAERPSNAASGAAQAGDPAARSGRPARATRVGLAAGIFRGGSEVVAGLRGRSAERLATAGLARLQRSFETGAEPRRSAAEDRAVEDLRRAVDAAPNDPSHQADLALAYLARGSRRRDGLDLLAALEATDRALDRDPRHVASGFVRALILGELALWGEERASWERVLALDPGGELAAAARSRLAAAEEAHRGTDWDRLRREVRRAAAAGDPEALAAAVARHPELARELGEEVLLAEWAEAVGGTRAAAEGLATAPARALGAALVSGHGEHLLADTVAAIERAGGVDRERLVAGLELYAAALPALTRWNCAEAEPGLARAAGMLAAGGAPLARRVRLHLAVCAYQRSDYEAAYLELEELVAAADAGRYPTLLARALGVQAVIQLLWGDHAAADRLYRRAVDTADRAGNFQRAASLRSAYARARDLAGDESAALALHLAALAARAHCHDPDREYVLLAWTASGLRDRWPRQAALFQHEAVAVAERAGDPMLLAEAYRGLALVLARLAAGTEGTTAGTSEGREPAGAAITAAGVRGAGFAAAALPAADPPAAVDYAERALGALAAAEDATGRVEDPDVRRALELETGRFAGEVLAAVDPHWAATRLDDAIERATAEDYLVIVPRMRMERARLAMRAGEPALAEASLRSAIAEAERQRLAAGDPESRIGFADLGQEAHELLAGLLLDRGETEAALAAWEEGRARALLDRLEASEGSPAGSGARFAARAPHTAVSSGGPASSPVSSGAAHRPAAGEVAEWASDLPAGTALIEYAVLDGRIEVWVLRRGAGSSHQRLPAPAAEVEGLVGRLLGAVAAGAGDDAIRPVLAVLHRRLLAPLSEALADAPDLVIVPHRFLAAVPYPALLDADSGRYLVEERTVRIIPSARAFTVLAACAGGGEDARAAVCSPTPAGTIGPATGAPQAGGSYREHAPDAGPSGERRGERPTAAGSGRLTALAVGDPAFDRRLAPGLPRLPGAGHEAEEVAGLYAPRSRLLVAEAATAAALAREVAGAEVVHLAAHALVDRERGGRSALLLARPAGGRGRGRLGPPDLLALDLTSTRLVVLAVCEGAAGSESASEGPLSLVRPFLAKGIPSVVAGLWPIEDGANAPLMVDFHRRVAAGTRPAEALAETQRALLAAGPGAFPIRLWAAFQSYGAV